MDSESPQPENLPLTSTKGRKPKDLPKDLPTRLVSFLPINPPRATEEPPTPKKNILSKLVQKLSRKKPE